VAMLGLNLVFLNLRNLRNLWTVALCYLIVTSGNSTMLA
jgi:hypothetical protein